MIGRFLFVFVLLAVSFYGVKLLREKLDNPSNKLKKDNSADNNENDSSNKMVKCLHCGLHIPENEAIKQGDKTFCTLEHAKEEL